MDKKPILSREEVEAKCPTPEYLRNALSYDPISGKIFWRIGGGRRKKGEEAGSVNKTRWNTYIEIGVGGGIYKAHRIAWAIYYGSWPSGLIDHNNGNSMDNSISNLRLATAAQNSHNATIRKSNTTGFKGVTYKRNENAYVAQIRANGSRKYLGIYRTAEEAHEVYCLAAAMLHGEFANFGGDRQS